MTEQSYSSLFTLTVGFILKDFFVILIINLCEKLAQVISAVQELFLELFKQHEKTLFLQTALLKFI